MLTLLPWLEQQWQQYALTRAENRLSHALLLTGQKGSGKNNFSEYLSASLLCFSPLKDFIPCGSCKSCVLFDAGNHPDNFIIEPEDEGKQIKVEQIRDLIDFINLKSYYEHYKVAVISPADTMNRSSANTLLKTLEEPPSQSTLILVSHRPDILPVTVRSRCQRIYFNPVFDEKAQKWLREKAGNEINAEEILKNANGAPLAALDMIANDDMEKIIAILSDLESVQLHKSDPVRIADKWNKSGAAMVFQWLLNLISDLVRLKSTGANTRYCQDDLNPLLQRLTNRLDLYRLMLCHDLLLKNYSMCMGQISYNTQGLLEDFLIFWQQQTKLDGGQSK